MSTESGKISLEIDAQTARAIQNLGRVASGMDNVKKKTNEAGAASKAHAKTIEETTKSLAGALGLGGAGGALFAGGIGAGIGVAAVQGLKSVFDHFRKEYEENIKRMKEFNKGLIDSSKADATASGTIKGLSQTDFFKLREATPGLKSPDELQKVFANALKANSKLDFDKLKSIGSVVSDAKAEGTYREGTEGLMASLYGAGFDDQEVQRLGKSLPVLSKGRIEEVEKLINASKRLGNKTGALELFASDIGSGASHQDAFRNNIGKIKDGRMPSFDTSSSPELLKNLQTMRTARALELSKANATSVFADPVAQRSSEAQEFLANAMRFSQESGFIPDSNERKKVLIKLSQNENELLEDNMMNLEDDPDGHIFKRKVIQMVRGRPVLNHNSGTLSDSPHTSFNRARDGFGGNFTRSQDSKFAKPDAEFAKMIERLDYIGANTSQNTRLPNADLGGK